MKPAGCTLRIEGFPRAKEGGGGTMEGSVNLKLSKSLSKHF